MYNHYSKNVQERREEYDKRQQEEAKKLSEPLKRLIATRDGMVVFSWLLECAGVFRADYNGKALDLAFQVGRRSIGNELFSVLLDAEPNFLAKFREYKKEQEKKNE